MTRRFQSVLWLGLVMSGLAAAGPPPAPTEVKITGYTDVEIDVEFRSDASLVESLTFESEMTVNGGAPPAHDPSRREPIARLDDGNPYFTGTYRLLSPDTNYCIRFRARDGSGESAPSAWACAHTVADPPPAPAASATVATGVIRPRPRITVIVSPGTYARGTARFTIERQLVQPGSPWVLEVDFQEGLDISQATEDPSPYQFERTLAPIDPKFHYVYRVCAQTWGGKACSTANLLSRASPLGAGAAAPASVPGALGSPRVVTSAGPDLHGGAMSRPSPQPDRPLNWGTVSGSGPSKFPPGTLGLTAPAPGAIGPGIAPARAPDRNAPHVINPEPPKTATDASPLIR